MIFYYTFRISNTTPDFRDSSYKEEAITVLVQQKNDKKGGNSICIAKYVFNKVNIKQIHWLLNMLETFT